MRDKWGRMLCVCGSYEFKHRRGSGACIANPDRFHAVRLLCARIGQALDADTLADMAFELPGKPSQACPF